MRRTLGTLVATMLLLSGCGPQGDGGDQAPDPTAIESHGSSSGGPGEEPSSADGTIEHRLVDLVSASQVGGTVSPQATLLEDASAVGAFTEPFEGSRMTDVVEAAVEGAELAPGEVLLGAIVALGCEAPEDVSVERRGGRLLVVPGKVPTTKQCLVPMTTVALVAVPSWAV